MSESVESDPQNERDEKLIETVAQAIRDSNGTAEAARSWARDPVHIPAHVYTKAAIEAIRRWQG